MRRALTAACIACLLLSTGILRADEPLAGRLPKDSLLYVGWAGKTKAFDASMLGQLLQEPGFTRMWGLLREAATRGGEGPKAKLIQDAWALGEMALSHPGALALVDFKMGKGEPLPAAALLLDLGTDREKFAQRLESILGIFRESGLPIEATKDGKLPTIATPAGPLAMGYMGNVFYAALGEGLPALLEAATKDNSLAGNPAFVEAMKAVGGGDLQLAFYLDAATLLKKIEPLVGPAAPGDKGPKFAQVLESLGVAKVKYLAAGLTIAEGGLLHTRLRIASPAPHKGILLPLAGAGLTEADLAHLPADTDFLAAWKASAEDLLAEARRILRELDPEADADFARELAKPDSPVKIVCQDIFGSLGQTWTFSVASSYGGPLAGMLLTAEVKDAAKLSAAVAKLEAFLGRAADPFADDTTEPASRYRGPRPGVVKMQAGDAEIHYLHIGARFSPMPVAPAWAVHKDRLYVALWPQVIQSAIENQGKDSLVKSADFAPLRARLGANPCVLTYMNTPRVVRGFYPFALMGWTMGAGMLAREGLPARPDWLPPLTAIEKHLRPEIGAVWSDKDGITLEGYGSVPGFSSAPLLPAMGMAVLMPGLSRARFLARKASSMTNLSNIGKGIAVYTGSYNDKWPPDLAALIEDGQAPGILVSPLSGRQPPKYDKENKVLVGEVDYIYIPLDSQADSGLICAYERPENHRNEGTNVLYQDLHVGWLDMRSFQEALKKTQDYVKQRDAKKP